MHEVRHLFDGIDKLTAEQPECFDALCDSPFVRIERIVSHGHCSPPDFWYDQPHTEWVMVVRGAARLRIEKQVHELAPGDAVLLPAHCRHRVEWTCPTEPTVWIAVHVAAAEPAVMRTPHPGLFAD